MNDENIIKNANLKQYYKACETGNIEKIKTLIELLEMGIFDYNNHYALVCAAKNNQLSVLEFFLNKFKNEYEDKNNTHEEQKKENSELDESNKSSFKRILYGRMIESFRDSMIEISRHGYIDILKFYVNFLGNIPNINDFEKCAQLSCENGHFEMIKYLLSTEKAQDFIDEKKYYNSILPTKNLKANDTIKYFIDHHQYGEKIKLLKLLEKAYEDNNGEIIEYLIFNKNMLYSKKVRQKVRYWTASLSEEYDIPHLFENRDKYLLLKKLEDELLQENNTLNNKLKI